MDVLVLRDGRARIDLNLPADVPPGRHRAVMVLDERLAPTEQRTLADFPTHDVGLWPGSLSLRRTDLYGEDER